MRRLGVALLLLLGVACDDPADGETGGDAGVDQGADAGIDTVGTPVPLRWCEGPTHQRYDPAAGAFVGAWPDDYYTRADADSPSGLRVELSETRAPWLADAAPITQNTLGPLSEVGGFGTLSGIFLRFDAPVAELPQGADRPGDAGAAVPGLHLLRVLDERVEAVPYSARLGDGGMDVIVRPLVPLAPATRHAVVATTEFAMADGGCAAPSEALRALLTGEESVAELADPALAALVPRYAELLAAADLRPDEISAAAVFTTHDDFSVLAEVSAAIRSRAFEWEVEPTCVDGDDSRRCDGTFVARDYRTGRAVLDVTEGTPWTLEASVWLPLSGEAPYPTVVFGHGLNGDREGARALARRIAPLGFAVAAIDAMEHGSHPTAADNGDGLNALAFLGIDLNGPAFDALALNGNFNQTNLDRLQLVQLLRDVADIDGDGTDDVDLTRMGYVGVSLGGMLGSGLSALSPDFSAAVFTVAGGDLLSFVGDNDTIGPLLPFVANLVGSEEELDRVLLIGQTGLDGADPAALAPFVLGTRLAGSGAPPDVLLTVSVFDETVPPSTGRALARALGAPQVPPVWEPIATLETADSAPLSANWNAEVTAGFFQYDRVSNGDVSVPSNHDNTPFGAEGTEQMLHFLTTWASGSAEIVDPYTELETPPLP